MKFALSRLGAALIFVFLSQAVFAAGPCTRPIYISGSSWSDLDDALVCLGLAQGSYRGRGENSRHTYVLHLFRYLNQANSFIAMVRNTRSGHTTLGFVNRSGQGNYNWYGIRVVRNESDDDHLEIGFQNGPLSTLTVEPGENGKIKKITLLAEGQNLHSERVTFSEAQGLLMERINLGSWTSAGATMSFLPADETSSTEASMQNNLWIARLQALQTNGTYSNNPFIAREEELPAFYVLRLFETQGYSRSVSSRISYVGVAFREFDIDFLFIGATRSKLLLFEVDQNGFLTDQPRKLEYQD